MKFFRVIGRSIRDSFKSVGRNFSLSLASITCVMITLIIVGVALIISYNVEDATKKLKKDLSIVVFISNDADNFDITSLETQIKGIENVDADSIKYQSKAEIKKDMMESNDTFQNIFSVLIHILVSNGIHRRIQCGILLVNGRFPHIFPETAVGNLEIVFFLGDDLQLPR